MTAAPFPRSEWFDAVTAMAEREWSEVSARIMAEGDGRALEHEAWSAAAGADFTGAAVPEGCGGSGLPVAALTEIAAAAGASLFPAALAFEALLPALVLRDLNPSPAVRRLLEDIAAGERVAVVIEPDGEQPVQGVGVATRVLVLGGSPPRARVLTGAELTEAVSLRVLDGRSIGLARFPAGGGEMLVEGAEAEALPGIARWYGALLAAADAFGAAQTALERAVNYAGSRRQFGVPIGSFQAVKHALVDRFLDLQTGRALIASAAEEDELDPVAVAMAKAALNEGTVRTTNTAIQVHGAIGYTTELGLHLYQRRVLVDRELFRLHRARASARPEVVSARSCRRSTVRGLTEEAEMGTITDGPRQEGRITDEAIDACRRRIGVRARSRARPHNEVATMDSIRHFAHGIGDDNPLFCDVQHAAGGPWGSIVAPPMFAMSMGIPAQVQWSESERQVMSGGDPLAGVGQYLCGERWLFARPIVPGVTTVKSTALVGVQDKHSEFGGGRAALLTHRHVHRDPAGVPHVVNDRDFYHSERAATAKAGKYRDLERTIYTTEQIEEIEELYAAETVRGAEPRYHEDVHVGDTLGPMVKGPMTVTDIISYHIGWGWGMFGVGALKLAHKNRRRIPKFYPLNDYGIPDPAQRCHWEDIWAQELGQPAAYDYASMRMNWFAHLVTNWIGDAGWLWKFSGTTTKFNYVGDTHWLTGVVERLHRTAATAEAELALEGVNQRGDVTCSATVTVLLPTRGRPQVLIPEPSVDQIEFATT